MHIRFLGGLSAIGASCLLLEDEGHALLIDAGAAQTAQGLSLPDFSVLEPLGKKLKTVFITHAHFDHAGAAGFLHDVYPELTFIGSRETLAFLRGRYSLPKNAPTKAAAAGEVITIGKWNLTPLAVRHSIPGSLALHIAAPQARILISGDFISFADPDAAAHFASPDIFICESTNAALPAAFAREEDVPAALRSLIARHAGSRILFTCFSSNLARLGVVLQAARAAGLDIYIDSEAMRNACAIAHELYADPLWGPYPALPREDFPQSCLVLSSGSQGEEGSRLFTLIKNGFLARKEDALILSANPIPGNEGAWRYLLDTAARFPAQLYLPPLFPVHKSGHACRDELLTALKIVRPRMVIPVHGQQYQRRLLAELAEGDGRLGIEARLLNDEEFISLEEGNIYFHSSPPAVMSADCARQAVGEFLSCAEERQSLARFGIAFVILVCSSGEGFPHGSHGHGEHCAGRRACTRTRTAGRARSVRVWVSVRGFFRNDAHTGFLDESCQILEAEVLDLWSQGVFAHTRIRQALQEKMRKRFLDHFSLAPLVSVLCHELSS
jgi:ribonuclease J